MSVIVDQGVNNKKDLALGRVSDNAKCCVSFWPKNKIKPRFNYYTVGRHKPIKKPYNK